MHNCFVFFFFFFFLIHIIAVNSTVFVNIIACFVVIRRTSNKDILFALVINGKG